MCPSSILCPKVPGSLTESEARWPLHEPTAFTFAHRGPYFSYHQYLLANCIHREFEEQEILKEEASSPNTAYQSLRRTESPEIVLNANSDSGGQAWSLRLCIHLKRPGDTDAADRWTTRWGTKISQSRTVQYGAHQPHVATEHSIRGQSQLRWAESVKSTPDFQSLVVKKIGMKNATLIILYRLCVEMVFWIY